MAKLTSFFKIVTPHAPTTNVQDNQFLGGVATGSSNWYYTIIQGSGSRLSRYNSYDIMDNDVDVNRALNIIAENMCSMNESTNLPIDIEIIKEDSQDIDDTLILTLNAALRKWCEIHGFSHNRLFKIARNMIKYGDCIFRKTSKFNKWEYIHPHQVLGAVVSVNNVSDIAGFQIRKNYKQTSNNTAFSPISSNPQEIEIVQASDVVRFTLSDDLDVEFPFGGSVLKTSYKVFKQVQLLEDCMVIFRIGRSTSRRVFTIPTKGLNPARNKQLLDTFKREISQRPIPSANTNNADSLDSIYNPQSIMDDIFLTQACLSLDTHINIIGIGFISLYEIIHRFNRGQRLSVFTINQDSGIITSNTISWAGITKHDAKIIKIHFSNDTFLECTPDHKMIKYDLSECLAENLSIDDRLASNDNDTILVKKIEIVNEFITVGCLTVDTIENNHNFLLESGIFVRNSDGTAPSVQKLDGDPNIGEMTDLMYLQKKLFRSLNIPLSYMADNESKALFNDGKPSQGYVEEVIFYNFIDRLQVYIEDVLTTEFKKFLFHCNINIDPSLYKLKLPKTSNYKKYQQSEIDGTLLNLASTAEGIPYLAKRTILAKYLQLSESEILENERLLKEERGLVVNLDKNLQSIYGAAGEGMGMGGGFGGGMDMGMGGGMPMGGEGMAPEGSADMGMGGAEATMGGAPTSPAPAV